MTDQTGWYEFVTPGEAATTHIGYVYEDGSVYLPEGPDVVDETDFRMAAATDRFWRLIRVDLRCDRCALLPRQCTCSRTRRRTVLVPDWMADAIESETSQ